MKKLNKAAVLGTTAILSGLIGASGALAQVDVITVTAQKREQTLQDTPVSVAAVTGEQIEQSQIRDAADLQTLVPSLRVAEFACAALAVCSASCALSDSMTADSSGTALTVAGSVSAISECG